MMTLEKLGFSGILADDMGLEKTVQAIAYLLARKQAAPLSAGKKEYLGLIVCPAPLIYNWENEIRRFALTGTPIENSLIELWSIFDFLMPSMTRFKYLSFSVRMLFRECKGKNGGVVVLR